MTPSLTMVKLDLPSLRKYFSHIKIKKITLLKNHDSIVVFKLVMTLLVPCTLTQETTPPTNEDLSPKKKTKKLTNNGHLLTQNNQYLETSTKFQKNIKLHPITNVYFNLTYNHEQLNE